MKNLEAKVICVIFYLGMVESLLNLAERFSKSAASSEYGYQTLWLILLVGNILFSITSWATLQKMFNE